MANSFVLTSGSYDGRYMKLVCTQERDIVANKSTISWTLSAEGGSDPNYSTGPTSVAINGVQVYYKERVSWSARVFPAAKGSVSGTLIVDHNGDGGKDVYVSMTTAIYTGTTSNYGGTWTLDSIPRDATLTDASDFTDQENPWITFSNPAGYPIHYVWLEPNPPSPEKHLCQRYGIPNTGSYVWELSEYDRGVLREHCTGPSCTMRIGMYYYVGDELKATCLDKTFTVVESDATRPTVNMQVGLNNSLLPNPDKFEGMYIQGKSRVTVSLSASGKYGAEIQYIGAKIEEKNYGNNEVISDAIQSSGNVGIVGYAKDSRGITGYAGEDIYVAEYAKPLVIPLADQNAILCYRSDGNGKRVGNSTSVWVKAKRFYYDLGGKNTCTLQYRYKPLNDTWDDVAHEWRDIVPGTEKTDGYDGLIPGEFALTKSYTLQLGAIDDIGEFDIKTFEIPTQDVALHLGKGGKNVAVGTYCDYSEDYTFYSEWKAIFDKDVCVGGNILVGPGKMSLKDYILSVINGGG